MRVHVLIGLVLFIFISGCSTGMPEKTSFPHTTQQEMKSTQHWDILAADVANQINHQLIRFNYLDTPVYVKETCGDDATPCKPNETAPFNEGFRDLLITNLVGNGVPTRYSPTNDSITVNYKTQVLFHNGNTLLPTKPGMLTGLAAGILVLRDVTSDFVALAVAAAIDIVNAKYSSPDIYEVIITTSLVHENSYLFRQSDVYYIDNATFWHYQMNQMQAEKIQMTDSYFEKSTTGKKTSQTIEPVVMEQPPIVEEPTVIPMEDLPAKNTPGTDI